MRECSFICGKKTKNINTCNHQQSRVKQDDECTNIMLCLLVKKKNIIYKTSISVLKIA